MSRVATTSHQQPRAYPPVAPQNYARSQAAAQAHQQQPAQQYYNPAPPQQQSYRPAARVPKYTSSRLVDRSGQEREVLTLDESDEDDSPPPQPGPSNAGGRQQDAYSGYSYGHQPTSKKRRADASSSNAYSAQQQPSLYRQQNGQADGYALPQVNGARNKRKASPRGAYNAGVSV